MKEGAGWVRFGRAEGTNERNSGRAGGGEGGKRKETKGEEEKRTV